MASHEEENEEMQGFHFDDVESDEKDDEDDEDGEPVIDPQKDTFFTQEFDVEEEDSDDEE
jgi:hypothetical protein